MKTLKKSSPGIKKARSETKHQKQYVLCRPPGAKMLHFAVHFTKSLPKVAPRLPKGSKNTSKSGPRRIYVALPNRVPKRTQQKKSYKAPKNHTN